MSYAYTQIAAEQAAEAIYSAILEKEAEFDVHLPDPDEAVREAIGKPFTVRASKIYKDQEYAEVWEYLPPAFTWTPKTYWVYFQNGKVVQWGEPGDFSGSTAAAVREYNANKSDR